MKTYHDEILKEWDIESAKYNERYEPMVGCCGGDYCIGDHNGLIRDWWVKKLSEVRKKTLEEAIACVPIEKIHQLPDDVGSHHETEHDRGWNDYRKVALKSLNDKLNEMGQ